MNDAVDSLAADERLRQVLDRTMAAALAVSGAAAGRVCEDLVQSLASILGTDAALVGEFIDPGRTRMRTLAVFYDGGQLQNFEYDVEHSPCRHIVGRDSRFVASGVHGEFAPGTLFAEQGFDAYAGYSLFDAHDEQIGLIVALGRRPLADPELTEALMKIFAVRAAAELERRRAAAALQKSETSYRAIFQAAQDAMFVHDWDTGAFVDVNPRACEVYGYSREEMLRLSVAELSSNVPPYTRDEAVRYIEAAKGGRTVRFEWQRRNKDGTLHWDEVVIQRVELGGERRILAVTREITERKRTEQALRDSESLYRGLFNASADAMVLRDADFRVVDVNPSYTTMSGYSREETIGAGRVLTVEDEDNARWLAAHRGLLAGGQLRFEFSARRKDGSPYEAEVRGMPVSWNERPHVLYVTRDITERKRAERALAASEEQYRGIFNASADALVLWNSELKVVDVNPAYLRIYRQRREDVVGLGYPAHYPKEYVERRQQLIRRALAGETCELQTQSYRPDGELFEVEWRVVPVLHRGEPHALAIARDITERKAAEAALRASEEQYRAVFEASVDGLLLWDAGHRIVDVNRAFLAMHGYRREELIGGTTPAFIPPELREQCAELLPDILGGKPCHIESRSRRRGGEEIEVEIHGVPVLYQGRPHVLIVLRDITERKRAEQALKLREEQYRVIFDGSADALVLWDEDIRIVDVNRAFTAMYGFAREEVIGGTLDSRMSPEAVASRTARMRAALQGQEGVLETETLGKDGQNFFVELRYLPITHLGRPHVLAIARNITERRAAEVALRASEEQYRTMFEVATDSLQLLDADGRVVDVNPAYERMYGRRRADVMGKSVEDLVPEPFRAERLALVRRALEGAAVEVQTTGFRSDGTAFDLEVRTIPFQHRGQPHVLGIARDITERKRAEERLRASEEQYRTIFATSADAMVLRDEHLRVVDVNPAFLELIQGPKEAFVGRVLPAFVVAPEREAAEDLLRSALAGRSGKLEVRSVGTDGIVRELEVRAMPMRYQGRPHVLAIARDITAERRAERDSRRLEAQLRQAQKMEAIGQLTGGIAHDFNNILASVMGYVVLAEERASDRDDAKGVEYLGQALASCRRARDLIQQMLTFSRGGRGDPRAVDLASLARETVPMLRASLPSTLELALHCDRLVPSVWVDEVQAHQVLLNLAINARDAMAGSGTIAIAVRSQRAVVGSCASCRHGFAGDFVELSVSDRGAGIAPELVERIFDPFFTTKAPGKGSGMGLSTVHGIVHEYGGHIVIDSTPGAGTVFRVLWPAAAAAAAAGNVVGQPVKRRKRLSGHVLLVDDEPAVLGSMRETMLNWGLEVDAHGQPEAALAAFEAAPDAYDVVVTDLAMPHLTGLELAAGLLRRRTLPVLLVSGFLDDRSKARASELGLAEPLRKPVETEQLRAALEAALSAGGATDKGGPRGDG